jgi:hypothetical protein
LVDKILAKEEITLKGFEWKASKVVYYDKIGT